MICLMCGHAEIVDGLTPVNFQRGKMHMLVEHVPVRVCPNCGEAYVEEKVTILLLQGMEKIYRAGIAAHAIDYERLGDPPGF